MKKERMEQVIIMLGCIVLCGVILLGFKEGIELCQKITLHTIELSGFSMLLIYILVSFGCLVGNIVLAIIFTTFISCAKEVIKG